MNKCSLTGLMSDVDLKLFEGRSGEVAKGLSGVR